MKIKSARGRYSRNREQHVWKLRGMGIRHRHKKIKWRSTKNPSCLSSFDPSFVGQRKSRDNGIWCIESTVITSGHCSRSVGFLNRQSGQGPQATACESDARLQRTMYLTTGLRMARRGVPKAVTFELRPEEDEDPRREVRRAGDGKQPFMARAWDKRIPDGQEPNSGQQFPVGKKLHEEQEGVTGPLEQQLPLS